LAVSLQVMCHKSGSRLPLLSARPAVTLATLKRAATNFAASLENRVSNTKNGRCVDDRILDTTFADVGGLILQMNECLTTAAV